MSNLPNNLFQEFPDPTRRMLESGWQALPPEVRDAISDFTPNLTSGRNRWLQLADLAQEQFEMSFGRKRSVAIVGPVNVGKSTLYNQLIEPGDSTASVSPIPGTTKTVQSEETTLFSISDTPGLDAAGPQGVAERARAEAAATAADLLVIVFDAARGITAGDRALYDGLKATGKPHILVANKIDLIAERDRPAVLATMASNLGIASEQLIAIAAKDGHRVERVLMAIVKAEPALLAALGQALPRYRWLLAWRAIIGSAATAGIIGLTPLPFANFVPLLGVQTTLVLAIARIYDVKITPARARELLPVLGGGYAGRAIFYQLIKLGGPPAWLVSAAVAAATTAVLGYAAAIWFERGERLTNATRKQLLQTIARTLRDAIGDLGRRPDKATLGQRLREALERIDLRPRNGTATAADTAAAQSS